MTNDYRSTSTETLKLGNIVVRAELLRKLLPDIATALFYAKARKLDYVQLSELLQFLFKTTVIEALLRGSSSHSNDLQDYLVTTVPQDILLHTQQRGLMFVNTQTPELLAELFENLEIQVAASIAAVVESLGRNLDKIQGVYGEMTFQTMAKLNKQRANTIGSFEARILHKPKPKTLVIFDVSGSMSRATVTQIVDEVVHLAYKANATLAIVSDNTFAWAPGAATSSDVLAAAQYSGTHYETLAPLFDEDWSTVITIADYDSAPAAFHALGKAKGHIDKVLDISLVSRPTYLAECVGQLADDVQPILIGNSQYVLEN